MPSLSPSAPTSIAIKESPASLVTHVQTYAVRHSRAEAHALLREAFLTYPCPEDVRLRVDPESESYSVLGNKGALAQFLLQEGAPSSQSVLELACPALSTSTLYLVLRDRALPVPLKEWLDQIAAFLSRRSAMLTGAEVDLIVRGMPLLTEFSQRSGEALRGWALIWRDHFLEENVALLRAFERVGVERDWIWALSKGDRTLKAESIAAFFRHHGYHTGLFDNNYPSEMLLREATARTREHLLSFVGRARRAGKRILLVDDGALLLQVFADDQQLVDMAVELTIVGIRRLEALPKLDIPVFDVARSALKQIITYPEVAESGVFRVRQLIPGEKFRGRSLLVIGYGTAGRHVASIYRNLGCQVSVVDTSILRLIEAAEAGFRTYLSALEAIRATRPFLVFSCAGQVTMSHEEFAALPDHAYVTGIATTDLSVLREDRQRYAIRELPDIGSEYQCPDGKRFIQLGDGRSVNLFRSEAIPNRANDIFKTATLITAIAATRSHDECAAGIHLEKVDAFLNQSGLFERYYQIYLAERNHQPTE